jgi:hypothetical protein
MAQDGDQWRALVNTVLSLRVPYHAGKFSSTSRCTTGCFCRRAQLHEFSYEFSLLLGLPMIHFTHNNISLFLLFLVYFVIFSCFYIAWITQELQSWLKYIIYLSYFPNTDLER